MNYAYKEKMVKNVWKFYALFMCVFSIWRFLPFEFTFTNAITTFLTIIGLVGLYGYAFNFRIGRVEFWAIYVVLIIFSWVAILIVLIYLLLVDAELDTASNTNMMIGLAVEIPLLYALSAYVNQFTAKWKQGISVTE